MSLDDDLDKQSYEIKNELKIRKVLEEHTDWSFEFRKNGKYDYDLVIDEWDDKPSGADDSSTIGFVELERCRSDKSTSWVTGEIPDCWVYYSFLERKIREYDRRFNRWEGLKENHYRTVYLKFNHALDNCFAASIDTIAIDGERTKKSDGRYKNTYRKLPLDHPGVAVGISDCVEFIEDHLTRTAVNQDTLPGYSG